MNAAGDVTVLHVFQGIFDGAEAGPLTQGIDGALYGMTSGGGIGQGGVIYRLTLP